MNIWTVFTCVILICSLIMDRALGQTCKKFNLHSLFCMEWLVILFLEGLHAYGLYKSTDKFYFLIFLSIIAWCFGWAIGIITGKVRIKLNNSGNAVSQVAEKKAYYEVNHIALRAVILFMFVITIILLLQIIRIIEDGNGYTYVRNLYLGRGENSFYSNGLFWFLNTRIFQACLYVAVPIFSLQIIQKKSIGESIVGLVIIIVHEAAVGGRYVFFSIIVTFFMAMFLLDKKINYQQFKKQLRKLKKNIFFISCLSVLGIVIITGVRHNTFATGEYDEILRQVYSYFTLCVPLGSHWTEILDQENYVTGGGAIFYGLLDNINFFLTHIGIDVFDDFVSSVQEILGMPESVFLRLGTRISGNNYVTWIWYFYADFRTFGVFFGNILFGFFAGKINKLAFRKHDMLFASYYLLFLEVIIRTFIRWGFSSGQYVMAYIILRFLFKKVHYVEDSK